MKDIKASTLTTAKSSEPASVPRIRGTTLARNTVFNFAGQFIPLLTGIACMPFTVHRLGPDRFGALAIAWMVFGYFSVFDLGLGRATTKFVAEAIAEGRSRAVRGLVWTSLLIQLLLGISGGVMLAGVSGLLAQRVLTVPPSLVRETHVTLLLLAVSLPVVLSTNALRAVLEGCQRFDIINLLRIPASMLVFVIPVVALSFGLHLPGIVLSLLFSRIAFTFAHFFCCRGVLPEIRKSIVFDRSLVRPLLSYGGWVTIANVVNPIMLYMDRFLIGSLLTVAAVGYYSAPFEAATKLWLIPISLAATIFPACSALGVERSQELAILFWRPLKYLLLVLSPIVLLIILFAHPLMQLWLGAQFAANSSVVLQLLAFGVFVNCFAHIPYSFLQGLGRPDLPAKLFLIELPLYGSLAWFMIARMGIVGAAAAWSIRVTAEVVLLFLLSRKVYFFSAGAHLALLTRAFVVVGLFTVITVAMRFVLSGFLVVQVGVALLLVAVFAWAAWTHILDDSDRNSCFAVASPLIRRLHDCAH